MVLVNVLYGAPGEGQVGAAINFLTYKLPHTISSRYHVHVFLMESSYPGPREGTGKVMWKGQSPVWKAGVLGKVAMVGTPSRTRLRCLRIAARPSRHVEEELPAPTGPDHASRVNSVASRGQPAKREVSHTHHLSGLFVSPLLRRLPTCISVSMIQ